MGQKNCGFNIWIYFGWTAMGVVEAMIIYFFMLTLFANAAMAKDNTLFSMGDLNFVAVVIVISVKLQIIEMHNKSIVAGLSVFLSTGAVFLWNILLAATYPPTSTYKAWGGFFNGFGQNPTWWMTLVFIVVCVYVLEFSVGASEMRFLKQIQMSCKSLNGTRRTKSSSKQLHGLDRGKGRRDIVIC